ncbi:MAG: glycosyltransferase family 2 protein, partial [Butyrivibrio sp.]|nr:glycosyltransferase family 2 protein [Butyrivibrio sp.]
MKKLVIIPAYNESGSIQKTIKDIRENAPDFDYIVINDCSTDGTKRLLKEAGEPFLDLAVNLGIGGAVQTGYLYAARHGYDAAVQFDGDGQHRPEYIES